MMKMQVILVLLLMTLITTPFGCAGAKTSPSTLPAPITPPILPSTPVIRLHTEIYEGPAGTINYGTFTFKWASTLSSVDPSTLTYATFLQGFDKDYTPFLPDTSRTFTNLPDGNYTFYVKAQNQGG